MTYWPSTYSKAEEEEYERLLEHHWQMAEMAEEVCDSWQPIGTAPKDRKALLLYVPENRCIYTAIWVEQRGWWEIFGGDWRDHLQRASHWMPLPAPPGADI